MKHARLSSWLVSGCRQLTSWKTTSPVYHGVQHVGCQVLVELTYSCVRHRWLGLVRVLLIHTLATQLESRCTFSHRVLLPWYPVSNTLYLTYDSTIIQRRKSLSKTHRQTDKTQSLVYILYYVFFLRASDGWQWRPNHQESNVTGPGADSHPERCFCDD